MRSNYLLSAAADLSLYPSNLSPIYMFSFCSFVHLHTDRGPHNLTTFITLYTCHNSGRKWCKNCGFSVTSMKIGTMIDLDILNNIGYSANWKKSNMAAILKMAATRRGLVPCSLLFTEIPCQTVSNVVHLKSIRSWTMWDMVAFEKNPIWPPF